MPVSATPISAASGGQRVEIVILPLLPVDSPTTSASAVPIAKLTSGMILQ